MTVYKYRVIAYNNKKLEEDGTITYINSMNVWVSSGSEKEAIKKAQKAGTGKKFFYVFEITEDKESQIIDIFKQTFEEMKLQNDRYEKMTEKSDAEYRQYRQRQEERDKLFLKVLGIKERN